MYFWQEESIFGIGRIRIIRNKMEGSESTSTHKPGHNLSLILVALRDVTQTQHNPDRLCAPFLHFQKDIPEDAHMLWA